MCSFQIWQRPCINQGLLGVDNDFRLSIKKHGKNFLLLTHFVGPRPVSTLMLWLLHKTSYIGAKELVPAPDTHLELQNYAGECECALQWTTSSLKILQILLKIVGFAWSLWDVKILSEWLEISVIHSWDVVFEDFGGFRSERLASWVI